MTSHTYLEPASLFGVTQWTLPPLILHPFTDQYASSQLAENSEATLMMCGLLPDENLGQDELVRKLVLARYGEMRMLYYLGKDLHRWIEQCMEFVQRDPDLAATGIGEQSFARFLTENPPESVEHKLIAWGVHNSGVLFARAIALNCVFSEPPAFEQLAEGFVRDYHRYADHVYTCYLERTPHMIIGPENFCFELYASGEYSRLLEAEWGTDSLS